MHKIITGFEFAILVAIVIGIAILLHVLEARRRINEARRQHHDDDLAYEEVKTRNDFKEALAHYNDTEHEQPCASMEPMCGAGKRLTEKEKREELARLNLHPIVNVPEHLRPDPYGSYYEQVGASDAHTRGREAVKRAQAAARDAMKTGKL